MKKLILTIAIAALSVASYGQEFLGIKPSGNKDYTINQFKAKGFSASPSTSETSLFMKGKVNGKEVDLVIVWTPKTKVVTTFAVFLPERTTFESLVDDFEEYVALFNAKYGTTESVHRIFRTPYELNDGYEMNAVELEKCIYAAYWTADNYPIHLSVEISKYKQVKLSYQNTENFKIGQREKAEINLNNF